MTISPYRSQHLTRRGLGRAKQGGTPCSDRGRSAHIDNAAGTDRFANLSCLLGGFDVRPDGKGFVVVRDAAQRDRDIVVALNWREELRRKLEMGSR